MLQVIFIPIRRIYSKVNVKDATAIQKFVAKIETGFPIGQPIVKYMS